MTLKEYVNQQPYGAIAQLSRATGISRQLLYNYLNGGIPKIATAYEIEVATFGDVTMYDWIEAPKELSLDDFL